MTLNEKIMVIDFNNVAMQMAFRVVSDAKKKGDFLKPYDFQNEIILKKLWLNETLGSILKVMSTVMNRHVTVIAIDAPNPWRNEIYPEYKDNRANFKKKKSEDIEWSSLYALFQEFHDFLDTVPAIVTLKIRRCEADDIIGTLILNNVETDNIIVSTDGDFKQLAHKATLVNDLYKMNSIRFTDDEAERFLFEKIILGDSGDNIPNMVRGVGPKTVTSIVDEHGMDGAVDFIVQKYKDKVPMCLQTWKKNKILIDLQKTPKVLQDEILTAYKIQRKKFERDFDPIIEFAKKNGLNHFNHELVSAKMRLMYG